MKYEDAMEFIEECHTYGISPGLSSITALCEELENPQMDQKYIHVAGTNGKGSVCAFIASALKEAGIKVGRYISPTIFDYRERFQINDKWITKKELGEEMELIQQACERLVQKGMPHPTWFEAETALAFHYFKKKACDIVVLETGMGGSLDATNIISSPLLCVLTAISRDHMQFLGDTLEEIAKNKCGIIKEESLVISAQQLEDVQQVLLEVCKEKHARLTIADADEARLLTVKKDGSIGKGMVQTFAGNLEKQAFYYHGEEYEIALLGKYQIENAVIAIEALNAFSSLGVASLTDAAIKAGLRKAQWKGRFSIIARRPYVVVDGAHNTAGAKKLAESIRFYFTNRRIVYIMGMFRDKEYEKVIQIMAPLASQIITVAAKGEDRALPAYELAKEVRKVNPQVTSADSIEEAVEMSYLFADKESVIVGFGSLSFLGDMITVVERNQIVRSDTHGK